MRGTPPLLLPLLLALAPAACDVVESTQPLPPQGFVELAVGRNHTCGIDVDGAVRCWGANLEGQLGAGDRGRPSPTPRRAAGDRTFAQVSAGAFHSCALTAEGEAFCWGANWAGGLGDGSREHRAAPTPVADGHRFAEVSAGWGHTCALDRDGRAWCWGAGERGQLGDGSVTEAATRPVPVAGDQVFQSLSAGGFHTCGLAQDGGLWCWGRNDAGQLGDGATDDRAEPVPVQGLSGRAWVGAGFTHSCARGPGGDMHCWGTNWWGEAGVGRSGPPPLTPQEVARDLTFAQSSVGAEYSCGVTAAGPPFCWGRGVDGQLGDASLRSWPMPHTVWPVDDVRFARLETGLGSHTCALTTRDAVYCWGRGESGELGNVFTTFSPTPVRVEVP